MWGFKTNQRGLKERMDLGVWQSVLGEIELNVSRASFATWFKNTQLLDDSEGNIKIGVPNIFAKQQLEVKFDDQIRNTLTKNGVVVENVEYTIHNNTRPKPRGKAIDITTTETGGRSALYNSLKTSNLNSKYKFDSYIVGSGNELAYAACQAVVTNQVGS